MAEKQPRSTTELLADIDREWKALMAAVKKLTPEQMTKPDAGGWSPKDNLAHLSEWLRGLMEYHMDGHPIQEVFSLPRDRKQPWDDDAVNAVIYARNRGRSSKEVLGELERVYGQLIARLRSVPFEDLLKPDAGNRAGKTLLAYVLANTTEHFAEHRATIQKGL